MKDEEFTPTCPICGGEILISYHCDIHRTYGFSNGKFIRCDNNDILKNSGEWVQLHCENDTEHVIVPTPLSDISILKFEEWKEYIVAKFMKEMSIKKGDPI